MHIFIQRIAIEMSRFSDIEKVELEVGTLIDVIDTFKEAGSGTTRLPFSKEEMAARNYIIEKMKSNGIETRVDGIGNIYGVLRGKNSDLAPVYTGSHIDTVKEGGRFDGVAGVVCGIEALRIITELEIPHERDLVVVIYTAEESTRFGMGCIGSRTMAGHLTKEEWALVTDENGYSLAALLKENGIPDEDIALIRKKRGDVYAAVELHIEQASNLEKNNKQIGVVTAICAPSNLMITIEGAQSHAGGTSMQDRRDAYMAAAEISLALEDISKKGLSEYTTGTVGYMELVPNAVNVIPGRVKMSIDVRDIDYASKNYVIARFLEKVEEIAKQRGVKVTVEEKCNDHPMKCDNKLVQLIEESCERNKISYMKTVSGAYHDSLFIGEFAPVGMIFVPSKNGISHSPLEWTEIKDIEAGTRVLAEVLVNLANQV